MIQQQHLPAAAAAKAAGSVKAIVFLAPTNPLVAQVGGRHSRNLHVTWEVACVGYALYHNESGFLTQHCCVPQRSGVVCHKDPGSGTKMVQDLHVTILSHCMPAYLPVLPPLVCLCTSCWQFLLLRGRATAHFFGMVSLRRPAPLLPCAALLQQCIVLKEGYGMAARAYHGDGSQKDISSWSADMCATTSSE